MDETLRILLLEDADADALLIERELRKAFRACRVTRVQTEAAFRVALDECPLDLVLADYALPAFDGLSALRMVRARGALLPVIIVSGALGDDRAVETLREGATDYVLKDKLARLAPAVARALREAQERAERRRAEAEIRRLNEDLERRVAERTAQLAAANAELAAVAAENARLYSTAQQAVRARETLLSAVSHDLRNLVAAINSSVKLLQRYNGGLAGPADPHLADKGLARIATAANKMNALINELLDFARLQVGQSLELYCRNTDLVALAQQVAAGYAYAADRHPIRVQAAAPEITGLWDAPRLERVLDNLLSNAIKYSPLGGAITVEIDQEGGTPGWAVFTVRDHGIGIPTADLPYLFEWFRRAGNVAERISGTGIGLASARQVVVQHGGTISVSSQEGLGAAFTVRLPLRPGDAPPREAC
jgi:two-component system OmpR family sensor kinase